ncbi:MAG: SDR family oxidoreductase [Saprospiraceae bacterium]|nr:SDR family oxidoreductase [Saprospiraceae bacterium]MCB9318786.1 SDR family oxidoreductase [Lewinellaceae bacterium]
MAGQLQNKRIVVIGGTGGIGLAAVRAFQEQGAAVIALGLETEQLPALDSVQFIAADACEEGASETAIQRCIAEYGGFEALYHVAGGSGRRWGDGPLHAMTTEGWHKTIQLNLDSVMLSNRAAIRHFLDVRQKGSILNLSSVLAIHPAPHYFATHAYATAKAGIIGFSKAIAAYYASADIRVNVLAPGLTNTPMAQRAANNPAIQNYIKTKQPLDGGRMAVPGDLTAAACFLLSDGAGFTTGQVLEISGGWSLNDGMLQDQSTPDL